MDEVCRKHGIDLREIDACARNAKPLLPIAKPPAKADMYTLQTLEIPSFKTISRLLDLTSQLSRFMPDSSSLIRFYTTNPFPLPHHARTKCTLALQSGHSHT